MAGKGAKMHFFAPFFAKNAKNFKNKLDVRAEEEYAWRHPATGSPNGSAARLIQSATELQAGQGDFLSLRLSEAPRFAERRVGGYQPYRVGCLERKKRGKEKVVTRAVAHAEMLLKGSGAG